MYVIVGNFFNRPLKFTESSFSNLIEDKILKKRK